MRQKMKYMWQNTSIKNKMYTFLGITMFTILVFSVMEIWIVRFSLVDFHGYMVGNSISSRLADALEEERNQFERYVKDPSSEKMLALKNGMQETEDCMRQLPYDYEKQDQEIYRITWSIKNAYEVYVQNRDKLLRQSDDSAHYIADLYDVYDMQKYLIHYVHELINENVYVGNAAYFRKYPSILILPMLIGILVIMSVVEMFKLSQMMNAVIIHPLEELADASRKIADNEFYIEDITVENQDELGDLVRSFNRMKNAMGKYAQAVEESRKAREKIHEQELVRVEMERQLESAKMEALVSQMNPHFLFNTLNVIAGMANLENAEITEKMTRSLSNLLRYSVHNDLTVVPLTREIEIVKEYSYLQHMRFGARIRFQIDCMVDMDRYEIPPFTIQPLVENAVIHGVSPKIEGGRIRVKVAEHDNDLIITVADSGIGMTSERIRTVREELTGTDSNHSGIALTNINKRLQSIYSTSTVQIYSKMGAGTIVKIVLPKEEAECIGF